MNKRYSRFKAPLPPPSSKNDLDLSDEATQVIAGAVGFVLMTVIYTLASGALISIANSTGLFSWSPGYKNLLSAIALINFIRLWDRGIRRNRP